MAKQLSPRPRPPVARRHPPAARPPTRRRGPLPVLLAAAAAVAVIVGVVLAIGLASDDEPGSPPAAGVAETRPVEAEGTGLAPFESPADDPAVGRAVPEVRGAAFDGTPVEIVADGRPKLVMFVAHWCPHCQEEVPVIVDWLAAGAPQGVDLVAVSTAVSADQPNYPPSAWLEDEGWTVPTLADDADQTAASAFGLTSFPYFVAVGSDGTVAARAAGEKTVAELEALVAAARR
ncbi:MAG TPA: TlpA disulfide reductase family protein [Acidimicrobiales bacterium]|nr:TlpA disulfide reductase family protein [Acidimicrobiales bacterium]